MSKIQRQLRLVQSEQKRRLLQAEKTERLVAGRKPRNIGKEVASRRTCAEKNRFPANKRQFRKLNDDQCREIRRTNLSHHFAALKYGVTYLAIRLLRERKTYKDVL